MEHNERKGQLIALAGFASLSCGDAVVKTMAGQFSPVAVGAVRFALGALILSGLLAWREGLGAFRPSHPWLQLARGLCLSFASVLFFWAIFEMPLADAMALSFVAPVFTALLSGPFLKEKVHRSVFVACAVALTGVIIVLRPNLAELGWVALLPLGSALFFSCIVMLNRATAGQGSALSMQVYMAIVATPILTVAAFIGDASGNPALALDGLPDWTIIARCGVVAISASTAHFLIYLGTQRAGASAVAPMSYIQMVVATLLGWIVFADFPDLVTWAGVTVIIAAGLYLWHSGRRQVGTAIG